MDEKHRQDLSRTYDLAFNGPHLEALVGQALAYALGNKGIEANPPYRLGSHAIATFWFGSSTLDLRDLADRNSRGNAVGFMGGIFSDETSMLRRCVSGGGRYLLSDMLL